MRKACLTGLLVALVCGAAALLVTAVHAKRTLAYDTGNVPAQQLVSLKAGQRICQATLTAPQALRAVTLVVAPGQIPRGPITVSAREVGRDPARPGPAFSEAVLSRRVLTGQPVAVSFDRPIPAEKRFALCVQHSGRERVQVWGELQGDGLRGPAASDAYVDGQPAGGDLFLEFPLAKPETGLAWVSQAFANVAPFKLGGMGTWTIWLLSGLVVVGVPLALGVAAVRAADDNGED